MHCQYCKKRLGITKLLTGQNFCSAEHRELHLAEVEAAYERLRGSFEFSTEKPKLVRAQAKPQEQIQAEAESGSQQTIGEEETSVSETSANAPEAAFAQEQPTIAIASLAEAVEAFTGSSPAEASESQDQPDAEIASLAEAVDEFKGISPADSVSVQDSPEFSAFASDLIPVAVQSFISHVEESVRTSASPVASLSSGPLAAPAESQAPVVPSPGFALPKPGQALDIPAAEGTGDSTPYVDHVLWLSVPDGYPPVVVSSSATLVLDWRGAGPIPLPPTKPYHGSAPAVPVLGADTMEPQLPLPQLPQQQFDLSIPSGISFLTDRPPQAPASEALWVPRQRSGYPPPPLLGVLHPQEVSRFDISRMMPPVDHESSDALLGCESYISPQNAPASRRENPFAPVANLATSILPRRPLGSEWPTPASLSLDLAIASKLQTIHPAAPFRSTPALSLATSNWQPIDVVTQLPGSIALLPVSPIRLRPATDVVALRWSSKTNPPPGMVTAPPVTAATPSLLLSRSSSTFPPVMPRCSSTLPLKAEACRLTDSLDERAQSVAYLQPSVPSPWSLVTWSNSLSMASPARKPSNLDGPAPLGLGANPGRIHELRPSSPSRHWYRLTPLLPQPGGIGWVPVAPMQASLQSFAIEPIHPGSEGTEPPRLVRIRVQPASIPVWALHASSFSIDPSFAVLGACAEVSVQLRPVDKAAGTLRTCYELQVESSTLVAVYSCEQEAPALARAASSDRVLWEALPPVQAVGPIEPFPALKRVAWSVTTAA